MKLSFITPSEFMGEFGSQGDFTLALAHLVSGNLSNSQATTEYERGIKKAGLPIVLDNGLFELHTPEPTKSLIEKAVKIGAHTFFAPDQLYNKEYTQVELDYAIALNKYLKTGIKVGAVVQGHTAQEYKDQLLDFNNNENVSLIGLSILSIPHCFEEEIGKFDVTESRIHLMKWMLEKEKEGIVWKSMHLLGIGDSYKDVLFAQEHCPWIISNDSSCAFQSGYFGKRLTDDLEVPGGKVKEKVIFSLVHLTDQQKQDIQYNIDKIKSLVK